MKPLYTSVLTNVRCLECAFVYPGTSSCCPECASLSRVVVRSSRRRSLRSYRQRLHECGQSQSLRLVFVFGVLLASATAAAILVIWLSRGSGFDLVDAKKLLNNSIDDRNEFKTIVIGAADAPVIFRYIVDGIRTGQFGDTDRVDAISLFIVLASRFPSAVNSGDLLYLVKAVSDDSEYKPILQYIVMPKVTGFADPSFRDVVPHDEP